MYVLKKGGAKAAKVAPGSQKKKAPKKHKKAPAKGEHKPKKKVEAQPVEAKQETPPPVEAKQETPAPEEKAPEKKPEQKLPANDGVEAAPEAKKPEEKEEKPEKLPPSSCVNLVLRGDAKNVPDIAHHRFIQRTSKHGRLQLVAEPRAIVNIGWNSETTEEWEQNEEVFNALRGHFKSGLGHPWEKLLEASHDVKHRLEEAERAKEKHEGWELDVGLSYKTAWHAKKVAVEIIADFTPEEQKDAKSCVVKSAAGKSVEVKPFEEKEAKELEEHSPPPKGRLRKGWKVEVEHDNNGWGLYAKPTIYTVSVKGGDGKAKTATIEILPATLNTIELELGSKKDKSNALAKLNSWLDKIGGEGAKFELKVGGGFEFFWGWKEQIEDSGEESQIWRAVYCIEGSVGMKPLLGAKFELTVSALQIAFGMPQCLTKHIGDLRLGVGLSGSVGLMGFFESKYVVGGKELSQAGGIKGTGNLTFGLELSVFAGSKIIYQIEAKGGVRTGITVESAVEFSHEGVDLKHQGQWDGVVLECSVTSYYLVYGSHEHAKGEWKAFDPALLWQKTKPLKRWEDKKIGETKE